MEIAEIMKALEWNTGKFPREAVEAAMEAREVITPELLRVLEDTVDRAEEIVAGDPDGKYFAYMYALYLLAYFREARAYPLVVRFARLDDELLEILAGDFITEDLFRVLASVCDGDTRPIEELVEDAGVFKYVRNAALRALVTLVAVDVKPREEVMEYFRHLFDGGLSRSPDEPWDTLVVCATKIHPGEVARQIAAAYEEELVTPGYILPQEVTEAAARGREAVLQELTQYDRGYIGNVVDELSSWACFEQPKRPRHRPVHSGPHAGRAAPIASPVPPRPIQASLNSPCPCGSGKKYKKCCGRHA